MKLVHIAKTRSCNLSSSNSKMLEVPCPRSSAVKRIAHFCKKSLHYVKRLAERSREQRVKEVMMAAEVSWLYNISIVSILIILMIAIEMEVCVM